MAVDTLQVTFEASDSAIKFAVDPSLYGDEDEPWTIQFYESGDQSGGGPGLITTNTTTERTTLLENSLAIIDFYGASHDLEAGLIILIVPNFPQGLHARSSDGDMASMRLSRSIKSRSNSSFLKSLPKEFYSKSKTSTLVITPLCSTQATT